MKVSEFPNLEPGRIWEVKVNRKYIGRTNTENRQALIANAILAGYIKQSDYDYPHATIFTAVAVTKREPKIKLPKVKMPTKKAAKTLAKKTKGKK